MAHWWNKDKDYILRINVYDIYSIESCNSQLLKVSKIKPILLSKRLMSNLEYRTLPMTEISSATAIQK